MAVIMANMYGPWLQIQVIDNPQHGAGAAENNALLSETGVGV
jgi:hypothetical protein